MSSSASPPPLSMPLPFLLSLIPTTAGSRPSQIVVLDHAARTVLLFQSHLLDSLLHDKPGPLPASKASIDAMPKLRVTQLGMDCAICLDGFEIGEDATQMPCKHLYHSHCIQKWLAVRGTCPVCRFAMPVQDHDHGDGEGGGGEGRVGVVNLWVNDGESMDVDSGSGHGLEESDSESLDEIMVQVEDSDPSFESSFSFSSFLN